MTCPACSAAVSPSNRFCTQCGSPVPVAAGVGADAAGTANRVPVGAEPRAAATAVLPTMDADASWRDAGEGAAELVTAGPRRAAGWFRSAAFEVRLAAVGTVLTVLAFLVLPYAAGAGTGANVGGRVWWRPILAVLATVLVALALRRERATGGEQTPLVVAVTAAAVAATEAGLVGLVSGSNPRLRIGYYTILLGTTLVLVAAMLAARRCDRLARAVADR